MRTRIVFITGTDTGVGKTVLTSLLLSHLRSQGARALALKPFCSGGRADAELLCRLQANDLSLDEVNPFYFPEPVAPLISARKHRCQVSITAVLRQINSIAARLSALPPGAANRSAKRVPSEREAFLLVEGSGGLLVPLGTGYTVLDLIARLSCEVLVVSRNRLGTINHTLLTLDRLTARRDQALGIRRGGTLRKRIRGVVLMDQPSPDVSSRSNAGTLRELIGQIPLVQLPYFGRRCRSAGGLKKLAAKLHQPLAELL